MGRKKADRPTGKFKLRTDQSKDDGKYTLYLEYSLNRKFAKTTTEYKFKPSEWDDKNQKVKGTVPNYNRINAQLSKLKNGIDAAIIDYLDRTKGNTKRRLTIDILRSIVQRKPITTLGKVENNEFFAMANKIQEDEYSHGKNSYSLYKNKLNQIDIFKKFVSKKIGEQFINCDDIDIDLINDYIKWRIDRGNKPVTINKALVPINQTLKIASIKGFANAEMAYLISKSYLPIKTKLKDEEDEEDDVRYLTEDQIKSLLELYPKLHIRTKDYIDMFLFVIHTGLRVSDIITLRWINIDIEKKELNKILYKGDIKLSTPLTAPAIKILNKWKERNLNDVFVFDILPSDFNLQDVPLLDKMRINKNRSILTSLNEVGNKLELAFKMGMHVGRHTFAVLALNREVNLHILSQLLGHSSILVTEKVYAKFLPKTIKEEVETKLDFNFLPDGY
ncbi:MAG: tyrosine-type recombinase/integrase [Prevotella sp.]|jgi:integrase|nr:tyrosine-type recombinase/integrase [Prevotella sp.]